MPDATPKPTRIAPREVVSVAELAAVADDSIVSRTLMNAQSGSLTLFAFAAGQRLSEHTAPYDALAHVLDGEAEIVIEGTPHTVGANQMLLMPANVPHAVHAKRDFRMLLTMLKA